MLDLLLGPRMLSLVAGSALLFYLGRKNHRHIFYGVLFLTTFSSVFSPGDPFLGLKIYLALMLWLIFALERAFPRVPLDIFGHESIRSALCIPLRGIAVYFSFVFFRDLFSASSPHQGWTKEFPFWAQVGAFVVSADLAIYWIHRAQHRLDFYWKFHKLHHSTKELSVLANFRTHVLEFAFVQFGSRLALFFLLGISVEAYVTADLIAYTTGGQLAHANIVFPGNKHRWVNYFLVTPDFHAVHHSKTCPDRNFGETFSFWDLLFGTFQLPRGEIGEFGIDDEGFSRMSLLRQHLYPLFP